MKTSLFNLTPGQRTDGPIEEPFPAKGVEPANDLKRGYIQHWANLIQAFSLCQIGFNHV